MCPLRMQLGFLLSFTGHSCSSLLFTHAYSLWIVHLKEAQFMYVREREKGSSICSHPAQFVAPFALHSQFAHFPHSKTLTRTQSICHSMFTLGRHLHQIEFRVRIRIQLQIKKMRKLQKKKKRRKARNGYHYQQAVVNVLNLNFGREFSANCANCSTLFGAARKSAMKF